MIEIIFATVLSLLLLLFIYSSLKKASMMDEFKNLSQERQLEIISAMIPFMVFLSIIGWFIGKARVIILNGLEAYWQFMNKVFFHE